MGIIKGVVKLSLSIVFILALLTLVLSYSVTTTLIKDNFVKKATASFSGNEEINKNLAVLYNNATLYFNNTNASSVQIPFSEDTNFTLEKSKLSVPYQDFKDSLISSMVEKVYEKSPMPAVYSQALTIRNYALMVVVVALLAMVLLFSGRFMLLGINFLVTSLFYFPTKFIFNKFILAAVTKNVQNDSLGIQNFIMGFTNEIFFTAQKLFLYLAIAGAVFIIIAILLKVLKIGLWFQGFFESQPKKKEK